MPNLVLCNTNRRLNVYTKTAHNHLGLAGAFAQKVTVWDFSLLRTGLKRNIGISYLGSVVYSGNRMFSFNAPAGLDAER